MKDPALKAILHGAVQMAVTVLAYKWAGPEYAFGYVAYLITVTAHVLYFGRAR